MEPTLYISPYAAFQCGGMCLHVRDTKVPRRAYMRSELKRVKMAQKIPRPGGPGHEKTGESSPA